LTATPEITAPLIIDYWKLLQAFGRAIADLPEAKAEKASAQMRFSAHRLTQLLQEADIRIVSFDGEPFAPELPVTAINAEDLDGADMAVVERTLEPTLVQSTKVIHMGKVLLKGAS
jgi:hypothetical protein